MTTIEDVVHTANDNLFDVETLLNAALTRLESTNHDNALHRLVVMALEKIGGVQKELAPHV